MSTTKSGVISSLFRLPEEVNQGCFLLRCIALPSAVSRPLRGVCQRWFGMYACSAQLYAARFVRSAAKKKRARGLLLPCSRSATTLQHQNHFDQDVNRLRTASIPTAHFFDQDSLGCKNQHYQGNIPLLFRALLSSRKRKPSLVDMKLHMLELGKNDHFC